MLRTRLGRSDGTELSKPQVRRVTGPTVSSAVILLVLLALVTSSLFSSMMLVPVDAQPIGLVCLTPASTTACPAPPVTLTGSPGSQLMVSVLVQGSDAISGFDITLKTNHTVLKPAGVSLGGSLLSTGSTILLCVGVVLRTGSTCLSTDSVDTLHLVQIGPPGFLTDSPATGLLFTAVFNVTGTATSTISYQTGCSPSSVSGTTTCVLFSNGGLLFPQATVQSATFTQAPSPTFTIGSSRTEIVLGKGETDNSTISLFSLNGFAGNVALSITISPTVNHQPTVSISPSSVILSSGGSVLSLFIASARANTTKALYTVTVNASGGGVSGSVQILVDVIPT